MDELDLQFTRYNVRFVRLGGFAAGGGKAWPLLPPALKARNTNQVKYEVRIPKDELGFTIYNVQSTIC